MQLAIEICAKMRLLEHLREAYGIDERVIAGAIAKLGSDVCDALPGDLGDAIEQHLNEKIERLEKHHFRKGDSVRFVVGGRERTALVVSSANGMVTVDGRDASPTSEAACTSTELDGLRKLVLDCEAARRI
jgi:hypothetical protein